MIATTTWATAGRNLTQLRHDRRTVVLLLVMPTGLMVLLRFVFNSSEQFSRVAPALLGVFPFVIMFLISSVTTLRERTGATLERLMTMPMRRFELLAGYAIAFGAVAIVQVLLAVGVSLWWLDLDVIGPVWALILITVLDALLGMALGLFISAFATTEFQAIQFMPAFVLPQFLLCGLLQDRDSMGWLLNWLSDVMPLSYAVDALRHLANVGTVDATFLRNLLIVTGCTLLALIAGASTLRRRTP